MVTRWLSWWDYHQGRDVLNGQEAGVPYFSGLLTATILKADPTNRAALASAFPEFEHIVAARQAAPNGILPTDPIERILSALEIPEDERPAIRQLIAQAATS